jgi:transporter family-2 protein
MIEADPLLGNVIANYPSNRARLIIPAAIIIGVVAVVLNFTVAALDTWWSPPLTVILMGAVALVLLIVGLRTPVPERAAFAAVPWWAWLGGLLGAFYVASSTVVAVELGATTLLGLALLGQLATALVIDHFGWLGLPVNPLTWSRVAGVALLGLGVWLVSR